MTVNTTDRVSDRVVGYLDQGLALPGDLYTDRTLFETEMTGIFHRQWLYACHVSQLPKAGDFQRVDVGGESAIVVRDRDGEIHGLLNVCRHRGARIVTEECGTTRRFTCPYHQWTYAHDGTLRGAPRMPEGFDSTAFPLKRVRTEIWNGFVFVNFSADEPDDLHGLFADATGLMAPFDIASAKVAHTEVYDVPANWKLVWENSQECYHCNANHPEFIRTFDMKAVMTEKSDGLLSYTGDRRMQFGTFPLRDGAQSLTMSGEPASARPLGEFAAGRERYTAATHLKPGFATVFSPDYGVAVADMPTSVGRTQVQVQWFVHAEAEEGVDYEVEDLVKVWDRTNRQDWVLCESVQGGVASVGFDPGPLSLDESAVAGFYYCYAHMMAGAGL